LSLNNQSAALANLGRREDALTAIEEAVDIYRVPAVAQPMFRENLAKALTSQGILLTDLAQHDAALTADRETVSIYLELATDNPERYREDLEQAVNNQSRDLRNLGRSEQEISEQLNQLLPNE
jgi:tetratricopeptide (TPR) repeat protein